MGSVLSYSLCAGIFLAAGYIAFRLAMASEKQPALNRVALIALYAASILALPVLSLLPDAPEASHGAAGIVDLIPAADAAAESAAAPATPALWPVVALFVYLAGAAAVLLWSIAGFARLALLLRMGRHERHEGYTLVVLDAPVVPFSFMHYIVVGRTDEADAASMVITHELAHLRHRHWLDLLLAQAACVLLWYNPAAWLMRKELRDVHEYQADNAVLSSGADARQYQMLLIEKAAGVRLQSLANSLDHSNLTKRITMMCKQNNRAARRLRTLALVPALMLASATIHLPAVAATLADLKAAAIKADTTEAPARSSAAQDTAASPIEKFPEFPGGQAELFRYLSGSIKYPAEAIKNGVQGRVVVGFTVGTDGKADDIKILNSISPELDKEAMRVAASMPAWTPATDREGQPVVCSYALPVDFKLNTDAVRSDRKDKDRTTLDEIKVVGYGSRPRTPADSTVFVINGAPGEPAIFLNGTLFEGSIDDIDVKNIDRIDVVKNSKEYPSGIIYITLK